MQLLAFLIPLIRYFHETVGLQMPIFISPHPYLSNSLAVTIGLVMLNKNPAVAGMARPFRDLQMTP